MNLHLSFQPLWGISSAWIFFVAAVALFSWISSLGVRGTKARWISFSMRLLVWSGVGILVWRGSMLYVHKEIERPKIAVLIDRSKSMSLPVSNNENRWEQMQKFLKGKVWTEQQVQLDFSYFEFGEQVLPASLEGIFTHLPDQSETHLVETVESFLKDKKWDGFVLIGDGVDTTDQVISNVQGLTPIVSFYPDPQEELIDVAVLNVKAPDQAFVKSKIELEFELEALGGRGQPLRFRLWNGDRIISERFLGSQEFKAGRVVVKVDWTPDQVGIQNLRGEFLRIPKEASYENNSKNFLIRVLRDRTRVLHVAGRPSWDERFLRDYLKENPNIDLISFFILRQPGNQPEASERELSLIPFPYQDLFTTELSNFDLVIFQNFNFSRYFSSFYLENIKSFVENGGAFLMLGGDLTYGKGGYAGTGLEQILPFLIRADETELAYDSIHPTWGKDAQGHPIFQDFKNFSAWNELPWLQGFHKTAGLQPDSSVLLQAQNKSKDPILAVRQVGQGRVAAFTVDTLWKWGLSESSQGPKVYRQMFNGIYRWLLRDVSEGLIEAQLGNKNTIQFHVWDRQYRPLSGASLKVSLKNGDNPEKEFELKPTNKQGEAVLSLQEVGEVIELTAQWPGKEKEGYLYHTAFYGKKSGDELRRQTVDVAALSHFSRDPVQISDASKSSFEPLLQNAKVKWVGEREVTLWDHPIFVALLLSLTCFEWWFRRQNSGS